MPEIIYSATGKRKTSIARVWLKSGTGNILVNERLVDEYFGTETPKNIIRQPLQVTDTSDKYDIHVNVKGGGISGQAEAIRHGVAKGLLQANPEFRSILKKAGLLTRDPRIKERKKYGQRGARARYQYSKR